MNFGQFVDAAAAVVGAAAVLVDVFALAAADAIASAAVGLAYGCETQDTGVRSGLGCTQWSGPLVAIPCWCLCCCLSLHLGLITKLNVSC